jgi:hypothetical protein
MNLPLPKLLAELIATGVWPSDRKLINRQEPHPLVAPDRVQRFAAEECKIILMPPPFHTIAQEVRSWGAGRSHIFWEPFGALHQIDAEIALVIGDFGMGSDSPIILNYALHLTDPPVFRLRWGPDQKNDWVEGARTFAEFASILGITAV